ncbi:MAG: RNA pseudouridine synthase [Coprobacter sp.]|nr:RNA pseudouridine synthase [Coprobacter sp.]
MLHRFIHTVSHIPLPEKFTFPFCYTPHPLCIQAAHEMQDYIKKRTDWADELQQGKMFGVLVVRTAAGEIGYLAAFSGILAGSNRHDGFVPPVYDLLQPDGFFVSGERHISMLNARIEEMQNDAHYRESKTEWQQEKSRSEQQLREARQALVEARRQREIRRQQPDEAEQARMIRESQFQKAEYKRQERAWKERLVALQARVDGYDREIDRLKAERKERSAALQQRLFRQFVMHNALGGQRDLCVLFGEAGHKVPPAGAGECAAPKLLQYAYLHRLEPLAMAEFWWGDSPKTEIRRHGHFYPACQGKCGPILTFMLQGLSVEPNPLLQSVENTELEILYEDDYLCVVNKPAGLLSVPGKEDTDSVYRRICRRYPDISGPAIVHRLDMDTSGVLVIARTKAVHQHLQAQFRKRTVRKRYIALLDGQVAAAEGVIELPLCVNPLDRPRQMVSREYGKPAVTRYKVLQRTPAATRISFTPVTGRTHQLRVHAAHPDGLNCPIKGDRLYGTPADRLYLHAESITFVHPVTSEPVCIEIPAPF